MRPQSVRLTAEAAASNIVVTQAPVAQVVSSRGRGELLVADGDVEANPGPCGYIRVTQFNVNGYRTRFRTVEKLAETTDILLLQETKMGGAEPRIAVEGFRTFDSRRAGLASSGGGVAVLVRKEFKVAEVQLGGSLPHGLEAAVVRVFAEDDAHGCPSSLTVASVYLPNSRSGLNLQWDALKQFDVVGGDWNCRLAQSSPGGECDTAGRTLANLCKRDARLVWPVGPTVTRLAVHNNGVMSFSCLDYVVVKPHIGVSRWRTLQRTTSDHLPIAFDINWFPTRAASPWRPSLPLSSRNDWEGFRLRLDVLCSRVLDHRLVRHADSDLLAAAVEHCVVNASSSLYRISPSHAPRKRSAWQHFHLLTRDQPSVDSLPVRVHRLHPPYLGGDPSIGPRNYLETDEDLFAVFTSDQQKANMLAQYFAGVMEPPRASATCHRCPQQDGAADGIKLGSDSVNVPEVTCEEVVAAIRATRRSGTAPGPDNISPSLLSHVGPTAVRLLAILAQRVFVTGVWPRRWKKSVVVPLHKGNRKTFDCNDFRPIQLSSVIGKLVERILLLRVQHLLGEWTDNQFASMPGLSAGDGASIIAAQILNSMKDVGARDTLPGTTTKRRGNVYPLGVFVDFADAFCHVDCAQAAGTALTLGLPHYVARLISTFGENQCFKVRVGSKVSDTRRVSGGVPQGSVLGPLIFAIWTHPLAQRLKEPILAPSTGGIPAQVETVWMADDLTLIIKSARRSAMDVAISCLGERIGSWCTQHNLPISSKTCAMLFRRSPGCAEDIRALKEIVVGQLPVAVQTAGPLRCLGMWLDPGMTLTEHVKKMADSLRPMASALRWIGTRFWMKRSLWFGAGVGRLSYCLPTVHAQCCATNREALSVAYHGGIKAALALPMWCHKVPARLEASMPSLEVISSRQGLVMYEKCIRRAPHSLAYRTLVESINKGVAANSFVVAHSRYGSGSVGVREEAPHLVPYPPPWTRVPLLPTFVSDPPGGLLKPKGEILSEDTIAALKTACEARIEHLSKGVRVFIATDGSVEGGKATGVAVRFHSRSAFLRGEIGVEVGVSCGGDACSYRCEACALLLALSQREWFTELSPNERQSAVVVTDSQGLLKALEVGPWSQRSACEKKIWARIIELSRQGWRLIFAFTFSHVGVLPNEAADRVASKFRKVADSLPRMSAWIVDTVRNRIVKEDLTEFKESGQLRARLCPDCQPSQKESFEIARKMYDLEGERLLARIRCSSIVGVDPMQPDLVTRCPLCAPFSTNAIDQTSKNLSTEHIFECDALFRLVDLPRPRLEDIYSNDASTLRKMLKYVYHALGVLREHCGGRKVTGSVSDDEEE